MRSSSILLSLAVLFTHATKAQTTLIAQSATANVDAFIPSVTMASNLKLNITTATTENTTFPFCPWSSFSDGIGFVSDLGEDTGTITYTFAQPVSISQMMVWNGYFDFELDHCMRNVLLRFRDEANAIISTHSATLPEATENDLTAHVTELPEEVLGVKKVEIVVQTLWGGNELSIRRIAFAGNGLTAGLADATDKQLAIFPVPAREQVTVSVLRPRNVSVHDANGREVVASVQLFADRAVLAVDGWPTGVYHARVLSADGRVYNGTFLVE
ncbi:MAG: T9SS type A sorting domain-containing protein [Flavobacteriales bacterium]|nr:T9SS type A sorting domain-containing protein [Flavobacteriales bacterium]